LLFLVVTDNMIMQGETKAVAAATAAGQQVMNPLGGRPVAQSSKGHKDKSVKLDAALAGAAVGEKRTRMWGNASGDAGEVAAPEPEDADLEDEEEEEGPGMAWAKGLSLSVWCKKSISKGMKG
jgi:hypothetical protein